MGTGLANEDHLPDDLIRSISTSRLQALATAYGHPGAPSFVAPFQLPHRTRTSPNGPKNAVRAIPDSVCTLKQVSWV